MIELLRGNGPVLRIGHRGAAALAPENTLESIEAALEAGVDLVELDVLVRSDATLVLAHDHPALKQAPTLDEALALLSPGEAGAYLDLKCRGCEREVAMALRRYDLLERAVVSSFHTRTLRALAAVEPRLPRALSYPEDRLGLAGRRLVAPLARSGMPAVRALLPKRIGGWLRSARAAAAALHVDVVSRSTVERCHGLGAAVLVWTVNDAAVAQQLSDLGVDGIITDNPRILGGLVA